MDQKKLIEKAEKAVGGQKELASKIGLSESHLRSAKAGTRGIPDYACVMIAEITGDDPITVIAASNLATEKKAERRKVWQPFVRTATAVFFFGVILNMTPKPANANAHSQPIDNTIYYVK